MLRGGRRERGDGVESARAAGTALGDTVDSEGMASRAPGRRGRRGDGVGSARAAWMPRGWRREREGGVDAVGMASKARGRCGWRGDDVGGAGTTWTAARGRHGHGGAGSCVPASGPVCCCSWHAVRAGLARCRRLLRTSASLMPCPALLAIRVPPCAVVCSRVSCVGRSSSAWAVVPTAQVGVVGG